MHQQHKSGAHLSAPWKNTTSVVKSFKFFFLIKDNYRNLDIDL